MITDRVTVGTRERVWLRLADLKIPNFLRALHPTGFRNVRALHPDKRDPISFNFSAADFDSVVDFARSFCDRNVYVGVATRADGKSAAAEDCLELHALFADMDFKDYASEAEARRRLAAFPLAPSATIESGGGLQCYWFLTVPLGLQDGGAPHAKRILRALATELGADLKSAEPARILRLPGTHNYKYDPPRDVTVRALNNRRYALEQLLDVLPSVAEADTRKSSPPLPGQLIEGSRNDTLFREGTRLRRLGWQEPEIAAALSAINENRGSPPLGAAEVASIAHSCAKYEPTRDIFPSTEAGDAEYFAECFSDQVRYDHRRGHWLLFTGHHWTPQTNGEIDRLALDAVRGRQAAALKITDDAKRVKRLTWTIGGEAWKRRRALLSGARSIIPIADPGDSWDLDPWLLGVQNGVVDLRTGTRRDGRPEDRITMRVRAPFDPDATCPLWDRTVKEIFNDHAELISYFDRFVGYSLTGDCSEEVLAFCWGSGANGKGTLMNTIGWLFGDYADDLPFSALELHDRSSIPNDVAKVVGRRFVTASESGETRRLNEARIKALTGRDPITARFLHREFFTFQPVAKFWLATNQKPVVRDTSVGFWRRIHLIPFTRSFADKPNLQLKDQMRAEAAGILARAVRGCLAWQRDGLGMPPDVRDATDGYQKEQMPLADFISECCVLGEGARAQFKALYARYLGWCRDTQEKRMTRREVIEALHARFRVKDELSKKTQRVWFDGVGLVSEDAAETGKM